MAAGDAVGVRVGVEVGVGVFWTGSCGAAVPVGDGVLVACGV
ncbi:MAG TPA: hypothetical protein VNN10_13535 [Dehalococcoidia bacterium]|nr:hypothetical protein [Dehalococcoidia bacterium]